MATGRGRGMSNLPAWMQQNGIAPSVSTGPQANPQEPSPSISVESAMISGPAPTETSAASSITIPPPLGASANPASSAPTAPPMPANQPRGPMMPSMMARPPPMMGQPLMARPPMMSAPAFGAPPPQMPPMFMHGQAPFGAPHTQQQPPTPQQQQPPPQQQPPTIEGQKLPTKPVSEADHWKEYKDSTGRAYYHDLRTNKTTYEKPNCLKSNTEKDIPPCKWKEYQSADGKVYYSDGINSVWTEPAELTEYKAKVEARASGGATNQTETKKKPDNGGTGGSSDQQHTSKSSRKRALMEATVPLVYESDAQRTEFFVNMLREYEIGSNHRWGDVQRICSSDARWTALKTTGQRKQCFSEYQTKRLKEEKEEKRNNVRKARDSLLKMLATDTFIGVRCRWKEAEQRLASKEEYNAIDPTVLDMREREEMFTEFVSELARKDDEEKRAIRKAGIKGFSELLEEYDSQITHASRWLDLRPILEQLKDKRFEILDENEKRNVFNDKVSELRKRHDQYLKEKEKERRSEEKAKRNAFKQFLDDKVIEGTITATSTWKDSKLELEKDATFIGLAGQPSSTARSIFDDVVDVLQKAYRTDRKYLRDLLDGHSEFKLRHNTTFDEFLSAMAEQELKTIPEDSDRRLAAMLRSQQGGGESSTAALSQSHTRIYFDEVLGRAVAAHEDAVRRHRKLIDRYLDLLEDQYYRSDHVDTTWEAAEEKLRKRSAFIDLRDHDKDRRRYFDKHMASLARRMGGKKESKSEEGANTAKDEEGEGLKPNDLEDGEEDGGGGGGGGEKRKDKKKKKKKHSRSDSQPNDSDSSSDSDDSEGAEKKSSKKKSSKKHKKSKKE